MVEFCFSSTFAMAIPAVSSFASFERARDSLVMREYKELYETGLGSMQTARQALERKPRAGFVKRGVWTPETVAHHSLNLARAAFPISPRLGIKGDEVVTYIRTALIHDLAEWKSPDYTPGEVSKQLKMKKENLAMDKLERLELANKEDVDIRVLHEITYIRALWDQYKRAEEENYNILKQLNKVDSFVKAAHYIETRNGDKKKLLDFFEWIEEGADITNPGLIKVIKTLKTNVSSSTTSNRNLHKWYFRELTQHTYK